MKTNHSYIYMTASIIAIWCVRTNYNRNKTQITSFDVELWGSFTSTSKYNIRQWKSNYASHAGIESRIFYRNINVICPRSQLVNIYWRCPWALMKPLANFAGTCTQKRWRSWNIYIYIYRDRLLGSKRISQLINHPNAILSRDIKRQICTHICVGRPRFHLIKSEGAKHPKTHKHPHTLSIWGVHCVYIYNSLIPPR